MARPGARGVEWTLFLALLVAYAYFNQGGGWSQNGRFAQIRSLVETGQLHINAYYAYGIVGGGSRSEQPERPIPHSGSRGEPSERTTAGGGSRGQRLERRPLPDPLPLSSTEAASALPDLGDISIYQRRIYPNKPPGVTFLAAPAYASIFLADKALGIAPDDWWPLTVAAYLTTVFSIGIAGALGVVVFHRLSRSLFPEIAPGRHAAAAWTLGLGTLIFPYATMLFDHVPVVTLLLLAFLLLTRCRHAETPESHRLFLGGLAGGASVAMNYAAVMAVAIFTIYTFAVCRPRARASWFLAGGSIPLLLLGIYHAICFSGPLTLATAHQLPMFTQPHGSLMGVFGPPRPWVALRLLVSTHHGLFFVSPVLLLSFYGLWRMLARRERRPEGIVCLAIFGAYLLMNASFVNWHGGYAIGPRYMIPAIPFLALPLAIAFDRLPRIGTVLGGVSVAGMLLATSVDPQVLKARNPFTEYWIPLAAGKPSPMIARTVTGPVSAFPMGYYELEWHSIFAAGSTEATWNSFNLGEFLFPQSLLSLAPLLAVLGAGFIATRRMTEGTPTRAG